MKKFLLLLIVLSMATTGYCAANNWGNTDLNPLLAREMPNDLIYRGATRGGVSTIVSTVSKLTSTHLAFSVLKIVGASKTFSMEAGVIGQTITLVKADTSGATLKLDMECDAYADWAAHTGFRAVQFGNNAGSFATFAYLDDTVGWILTGTSPDVTITYQ